MTNGLAFLHAVIFISKHWTIVRLRPVPDVRCPFYYMETLVQARYV